MLTIRPDQLKALSQAESDKYEDWMLAHLKAFFPKWAAKRTEGDIRATIRYGIQRATSYGLTAKRDVCKYIDHMAVFGRDFDIDARYPWAARLLNAKRIPSAKIRTLSAAAQEQLRGR